jgi:hypothetical protein
MAVLPPVGFRRRVAEAFQLGQRLGQLRGVVLGIDDRVAPAVVDDQAGREPVIAESRRRLASSRPAVMPPCVLAVDDLLQARNDVRMAMLAQLHHDPAAAHFVGHGAGGAGAGEGVEDEVAAQV